MAETPQHRKNMTDTIEALDQHFAGDPLVYVSGNMFVYYVPGDRLRHVAPDVFLVRGIPKNPERRRYLVWEEGKGPDFIVEMTSESTREEDIDDKFDIYQDWMKVPEYFLFDPYAEYLKPPLRGYRLVAGVYQPIEPVNGRFPSEVLDLHLERHGGQLRLYDPRAGQWLPTPSERAANAEAARATAQAALVAVESELEAESTARARAEAEADRLRREVEELRRQLSKSSPG
jgi:Uma2 family endonuclease